MRTPKENKRKPRNRTLKSAAGTIPKAALKTAWIKTKEQTRTAARENDTDPRQQESTDLAGSAAEQSASFVWRQWRKLAETQARQHRQKEVAARAHAAGERGVSPKQVECGTLPDAEPRPPRGADLPRQRAKEKAVTAKTAPRDIRGVTQSQRRTRTAANETVRSVMPQAQMQTHAQKIRLAAQKAAAGTGRTAVAVRSAIRHFLLGLHSLVAAIAAGISVALSIIIVISLVAFVSGSAYGIFFAADAPNAASVTVREAVETLTEEYRDRLEEISDTVQHDRQDITANDDVYFIRWQDVLAVFSSYVSGNEQGAPVAALTEEQVDKLREIMWAMDGKWESYRESLQKLRGKNFIVINDFGWPISPDHYGKIVDRVAEKAGIRKIHPHMFRHTFVSILLSNPDIGVATVAAEAGHAQPSTTLAIYTQVYHKRQDSIRNQMSETLYKNKNPER